LAGLGYEVETHRFPAHGREFRNLLATLPGSRRPEERVLVVAHYDTVADSPGADDNGSGVAGLLELARVLAPLRFERTVQFVAVNLEENQEQEGEPKLSTVGSRALAVDARAQGWQIEGVLVLESIAYAGTDLAQQAPAGMPMEMPERGDFLAVVGNEASLRLVEAFGRAVERHDLPLPLFPIVVPGKGEVLPDTRRSDHSPFWDNDYPAVMLTDTANFRNPNYHRPGDTLETLNLDFAAAVCRAVAGVVAELAG
ncbi:MAG: M28 family peptidase, partial [Anaerolineae bacterium]